MTVYEEYNETWQILSFVLPRLAMRKTLYFDNGESVDKVFSIDC